MGIQSNYWFRCQAKFLTSRHVRIAQSDILPFRYAEKTDD